MKSNLGVIGKREKNMHATKSRGLTKIIQNPFEITAHLR
jgi:hypothetical protein